MDAAIDAMTQETDEQLPVQDASKQKHGQERQWKTLPLGFERPAGEYGKLKFVTTQPFGSSDDLWPAENASYYSDWRSQTE